MEEQPNEEHNSTLELYFVGFVFWLSNIINKCTFCFKEIYEENELVRNAIDCTVYISEYTCKQCSTKREEPMERTWLSTNYIHRYNETLVEDYLFLNNNGKNSYYDCFKGCKKKKTDLIIIKGEFSNKNIYNRESYYICLKYLNLLPFYEYLTDIKNSSDSDSSDDSQIDLQNISLLEKVTSFSPILINEEKTENIESIQNKIVRFHETTRKNKRPSLTRINSIILDKICKKELKPVFSNIRFLSITYTNKHKTYPITLNVDKEWLVVGNEILGRTHILRMLEYQNEPFDFSMDYVVDIIDSNINIFQIRKNQYLKIGENNYTIEESEELDKPIFYYTPLRK
jgi:hypothetical protein